MSKIGVYVPKGTGGPREEIDWELYPPTDEPLGSPATLEVSFYNLFTKETSPESGEYEDLDIETDAEPVIERTVTLDQGFWANRQQTDHFHYYRNKLEITPEAYEAEFGPTNADRFKREPLEPIIVEDPDTDPPNIKDRDSNMRWDGIGVKTPMFHVDLIRDTNKAYSETSYKMGKIERMVNKDLKKGVADFIPQGYDLPRKYSSIKIKKTTPLTYVIDNIWIDKAHLSIEEIESASNYVTSIPMASLQKVGDNYEVVDANSEKWCIDAVEGIFYNKFDTFLCKDREFKIGDGTIAKKYKITAEPRYSADAIEKPILEFYSGGIIKVKAYMVPRNWWYYARFYSPGAYDDLGPATSEDNRSGLKTMIYRFSGEELEYTSYWDSYVKSALRDPISNYTNVFSLWSRPPHDYRLPIRDDTLVPIWDGDIPPSEYPIIRVSWVGGFSEYKNEEIPPGPEDGTPLYFGISEGMNPIWSSTGHEWPEEKFDNATIRPLNDMGFADINVAPDASYMTVGSRGNGTKGWTSYIDSKYGFFEGGMRGLFLYNFSAMPWHDGNIMYYLGNIVNCSRVPLDRGTEAEPWLWTLKADEVVIVPMNFSLFHKTPTGCVAHAHTRSWYNRHIGDYSLRGHGGSAYCPEPTGSKIFNRDYQLMYACSYTPPDGGVWKSNDDVEPIVCGIQHPDENPEKVVMLHGHLPSYFTTEPHDLWPQNNKYPYDGKDLYDEGDIEMFGKFWTKFTDSNLYKNNNALIDSGTYPADNVPFITGMAGAKAESLVAILDIDGKIYYIWRETDEEEDIGYDDRPLLPINAGTNMTWTAELHTFVEFHPIYGCGEIYNEWTEFGNIKTLYNSETLTDRPYPYERPCDYRIAIEMVHQGVNWYDEMTNVNELMISNPGCIGTSEAFDEDCYPYQNLGTHYSRGPLGRVDNANIESISQETLWEFEMPIYIMTYREIALYDSGPGASRWCGSLNKLRDGTTFTVSAANRNRDSCGVVT